MKPAQKILVLNLPADELIVRRYMCSSFAEQFLFPPHELLSLAGIARNFPETEVVFIDAIAERLAMPQLMAQMESLCPDVVVSIISFELYDSDVAAVKTLKEKFPGTYFMLFGHYPTHFPEETLQFSKADMVIKGEPDLIFSQVIEGLNLRQSLDGIAGIAHRNGNGAFTNLNGERRIPDPNVLPIPAYDLLKIEHYGEPFLPKPFGLIQSARGCPYQCNYCVKSFGTKLTMLTPENILEHIIQLRDLFGIRSLRFIDDTFTAIPARVIKICKLMIENNINLKWTCLSRADTLDEEMLHWMKKAGCVRLNIGMESGSQRMLDVMNKGIDVGEAKENLLKAKDAGLETMGFFLTGIPGETQDDVEQSLRFAQEARFDYIAVDTMKLYPGTSFYDQFKDMARFSLVPYLNGFLDEDFNRLAEERRNYLYRNFYFSLSYVMRAPKKNLLAPEHWLTMTSYVLNKSLGWSGGKDNQAAISKRRYKAP